MNKRLGFFILAVLLQAVIVAVVPAKHIHARVTGKLVTIKTAPVDPYDFLSGYHVVLSYEISRPEGFDPQRRNRERYNGDVYVVLKEGEDGIWSAGAMHDKWPQDIAEGCIVIKGKKTYRGINYGIESYFIPEENRSVIEKDLRKNQRQAKAQIKIDKFGNAALVRLIIDDRVYEY